MYVCIYLSITINPSITIVYGDPSSRFSLCLSYSLYLLNLLFSSSCRTNHSTKTAGQDFTSQILTFHAQLLSTCSAWWLMFSGLCVLSNHSDRNGFSEKDKELFVFPCSLLKAIYRLCFLLFLSVLPPQSFNRPFLFLYFGL